MKYTRKIRKQKGRGIISSIKSKTTIKGVEIPYKKVCPPGYSMCDQDEVNSGLCVQNGQEALCSDPNYTFRYLPPDEKDRNGLMPKNRLERETDGFGPIQDPTKPVKAFNIEYDGEPVQTDNPENPIHLLEGDVIINEETGRLKSYVPEFHPTSCTIQQKESATIDTVYNDGDAYIRRVDDAPKTLANLSAKIPSPFKVATQNALGLYWGTYREKPAKGSPVEASFDIMELRTALLRDFLSKASPDFICFQESTRTWIDLLDKERVPEMYPYIYPTETEMIEQESNGANATVSIMSKYPAKRATTYMLQGNSSYFNALGIYEFENLVIVNVYMQAGAEISPGQKYKWENYARCRRQQLMFIKQKIDAIRGSKAIVVLGDFNFELNSIRYQGEGSGAAARDANRHLIYDPTASDMKWAEHKFLVGEKGLNLNDSYKELHIDDPDKAVSEGYTEYTDVNTFRFLGKLEEKMLRYDGIFFNNDLVPIYSEVINNSATILDDSPETVRVFEANGISHYRENIRKYNTEYNNFMIFNPRGNMHADAKKREFLSKYRTKKGTPLSIEDGFELFVSDHFGVMTEFQFKNADSMGGKRRRRKITYKRYKKNKKFLTRRK
jgi:exonuclease III